MNLIELGGVVAKIQLGDGRQVDEAVLAYWFEAIGHLPVTDALDAVLMHRQERPGEWLDVGHVLANAKRVREARAREIRLKREAIEPPRVTLDREAFDRETEEWIAFYRDARARQRDG